MKKSVLFMALMLLGVTSATATTTGYVVSNGEDFNNSRYRFAEPIVFIERGVEFLIFPDGSFDFNTEIGNNVSQFYYRNNGRRSAINRTHGAPGTTTRGLHSNYGTQGVLVTHDQTGKVRRIGNVYINYDRYGRIKRAGTVYMRYQRGNGLLRQVGGLRVAYNRWGQIVFTTGVVNPFNTTFSCETGYNSGGNGLIDHTAIDDYDDAFYYYRKNGEIKKSRKIKRKLDP